SAAATVPSHSTGARRPRWAEPARRARLALVTPVLVALVASGCGGSSKPAVCGNRDAVKAAVNDLLSVNPIPHGMTPGTTKPDAVQPDVNDLASAAGSQYQPQINALKSSLSALSAQVKALGSSPSAAAATAIVPAAQKVATDFTALTDAIGSACD